MGGFTVSEEWTEVGWGRGRWKQEVCLLCKMNLKKKKKLGLRYKGRRQSTWKGRRGQRLRGGAGVRDVMEANAINTLQICMKFSNIKNELLKL